MSNRDVRLFLSDCDLKENEAPIPMPLVVSAVHNFLVEQKLRSKASLIIISGDAIEDHHYAVLTALGASAIYPIGAYSLISKEFKDTNFFEKIENYFYRKRVIKNIEWVYQRVACCFIL